MGQLPLTHKTNNMKQQTAVEWLVNELLFIQSLKEGEITESNKAILTTSTIKQAKQMEKEQMKNIWGGGKWSVELGGEFEQYYNETYGGQGSPDTTTSPTK